MKKIILTLSIAFFITTNVFAAGSSSSGSGGSSEKKTNYDKAHKEMFNFFKNIFYNIFIIKL